MGRAEAEATGVSEGEPVTLVEARGLRLEKGEGVPVAKVEGERVDNGVVVLDASELGVRDGRGEGVSECAGEPVIEASRDPEGEGVEVCEGEARGDKEGEREGSGVALLGAVCEAPADSEALADREGEPDPERVGTILLAEGEALRGADTLAASVVEAEGVALVAALPEREGVGELELEAHGEARALPLLHALLLPLPLGERDTLLVPEARALREREGSPVGEAEVEGLPVPSPRDGEDAPEKEASPLLLREAAGLCEGPAEPEGQDDSERCGEAVGEAEGESDSRGEAELEAAAVVEALGLVVLDSVELIVGEGGGGLVHEGVGEPLGE